MGDSGTGGNKDEVQNAASSIPLSGTQDNGKGATDHTMSTLYVATSWAMQKGQGVADSFFPPDKREAFSAKLKAFVCANPKLSAFLAMNLALTGIPLALFVLYSLSVFVVSLLVGIIVGLLGAMSFTLLAVGAALLVVLPTVLFTTSATCFIFLWGLGGYYMLRWASKRVHGEPKQAYPERAIGNHRTDGPFDELVQDARREDTDTDQLSPPQTNQHVYAEN